MASMKRPLLRLLIAALLVAVTFLAVKLWTGKYDRDPDPRARYRIEAGAFDSRDAALAACRPIQSSGRPCLVVEATTNDRRVAQSGVGPLSLLRSPQ